MKTIERKIRVTFTEDLLATASGNPEIHQEFIASKAPGHEQAEEELAALPAEAQTEKASTVFHHDDTGLFLFDYHWRGFIKECIGVMCELGEFTKLTKWTFKRAVDCAIFVSPRKVYLTRSDKPLTKPDGTLQRPLRASTMQGDRVALARSEFVSAGTQSEFTIKLLQSENTKSAWKDITPEVIQECLKMGEIKGHGQWRGGGYGRFTFEEVK